MSKLLGSRPGNRLKNNFGLTKPVLFLLLSPTEYPNNIIFYSVAGVMYVRPLDRNDLELNNLSYSRVKEICWKHIVMNKNQNQMSCLLLFGVAGKQKPVESCALMQAKDHPLKPNE